MGFIRDKREELTGYQESEPWNPRIDLNIDFVMVYGNDETLTDRIVQYSEKGYRVHLMTGITWGDYTDFLDGKWDGKNHWDIAQCDCNNNKIMHGERTPYVVPTIAFADYLTDSLKKAVAAGVEAIHLEEPEFWDEAGYSKAFKREFELYYRKKWQPQTKDLKVHYETAQLKATLFARVIERVADGIKAFAKENFGRDLRVYIPTHSLINYSQWKIMSPEGKLAKIDAVDGFIAQVWTGTSRTPTIYAGKTKERTFETAFCEYGIMQEIINKTNKSMWFLNDPIEDNPSYDWEDYQENYLQTIVASLLHPHVHQYEICPWPNRVFNKKYYNVKKQEKISIPEDYNTILNSLFQTLGNMKQSNFHYAKNNEINIRVAMSDTAMYQRTYPDNTSFRELQHKMNLKPGQLELRSSDAFPQFFGLIYPLLKNGLPVTPLQIDNLLEFPNYLTDVKYLILNYDYMKPSSPAINSEITSWVKDGGHLIYVGNEKDPYHAIDGWWNKQNSYITPTQHLFASLGIEFRNGIYDCGKGSVEVIVEDPSEISSNLDKTKSYVSQIDHLFTLNGDEWEMTNNLTLYRGPYIISASMDESFNTEPMHLSGDFVDLFTPDYALMTSVDIKPNDHRLLFDLDKINEDFAIVGTSARIEAMTQSQEKITLQLKAPDGLNTFLRLKINSKPTEVFFEEKNTPQLNWKYDGNSQTILLNYRSGNERLHLTLIF